MGGGLINIVSYGANDLYITGSPQITFFKVAYRRHTNFSIESIAIDFGEFNFGDEINVQFPKVGDLFSNTYIQIDIPAVHLKKTDIASDLSSSETTLLNSEFPIPLTDEQIAIVDDYQTIIDFQKINCAGYRIAVDNKSIQNQTTEQYVLSILNAMIFTDSVDTAYRNALSRARDYESSIDNNTIGFVLDYRTSDITYILTSTIVTPDSYLLYTINDVYLIVSNAINTSKKVKKYYFEKVKEKSVLTQEYSSTYAKFAWIHKLGHAIIDRVDINIGGERIDRHYGEWINLWYELTSYTNQTELYNRMIGDVITMTTFDKNEKPAYTLTIPLSFWFCRKIGSAFPIIALQYNTISLTLKLHTIEQCAYVENVPTEDLNGDAVDITQLSLSDVWDNLGLGLTGRMLVDYIYLDNLERKRFAQSAHEYLIETNQRIFIENTNDYQQLIEIEFNGPSKEIIWFAQKTVYIDGDTTKIIHPFNYSLTADGVGNPFTMSKLLLNSYEVFNISHSSYYNNVIPYAHHTRNPSDGINVYSFSLFPEEHQPSGTCNFSRISNIVFMVTLDQDIFKYNASDIDPTITPNSTNDSELDTSINIVIYSQRYDIIRFIGGLAGFAYKYGT